MDLGTTRFATDRERPAPHRRRGTIWRKLRVHMLIGPFAALAVASGASTQPKDDRDPRPSPESPIRIETGEYGFEWCVIGDPGNVPFPGHWQTGAFAGYGSIPYEYRLTRTEVSVQRYHEFITAYAPYYDGNPTLYNFTGDFIFGRWDGEQYVFVMAPGMEEVPATMTLRRAARYCNWLHNDKVEEEWAFETGCYDASTFTRNPDGTYNDDYTVLPGARFWIPSAGEWLKGVFYDPNRSGEDRPGWWGYPNRSAIALRIGPPIFAGQFAHGLSAQRVFKQGGRTNASGYDNLKPWTWRSGLYTWEQSPWGLLDTSGGMTEMGFAWSFGTSVFNIEQLVPFYDQAGQAYRHLLAGPNDRLSGFRMASPAE